MQRVIVVLSALFLLISGTAKAEPAGRGRLGREMMNYGPGHYSAVLSADPNLNLTPEQMKQLQALDDRYAQEIKPFQVQLSGQASELRSEWLQVKPNQGKINALQRDVTNLRNQMRKKMEGHHKEILNILTPEQQAHMQNDRPGRDYYKKAGFGRQ